MTFDPTGDAPEIAGEDDLVSFFARAERPDPRTHLVGTELEKFGVVVGRPDEPLEPISYEAHIVPVLAGLIERCGWTPGPDRGEHGETIELRRGLASITLEPGGQLELSGAPLSTLHETCAEFTNHVEELDVVSRPLGIAWMVAGHHPWATRDEIHWTPKGRYRVMRGYLPTRGGHALDMMLRTCTVQANFDYASERQCGERLRLAAAIAPVVMAMFANSPYLEGERVGIQSVRSHVWTDVDPDRCGIRPFFFEPGFSYARYVGWALDVPMFFVKRDGAYHPDHRTFRTFLRDGFTAPDGRHHRATMADWATHVSTLFPEIRLRPHLEFRSVDAVDARFLCAMPALLKGLLYDDDATAEAWDLVAERPFAERVAFSQRALERGLHDPELRALAQALLRIARASLERADVRDAKGRSEARFLDGIEPWTLAGRSPGDEVAALLGDTPGRSASAQHAFAKAFHFAGVQV